jgi:hypothetical protein
MLEKKVLDVVKVGFYGNTSDNRSPEDFAFPACMASLMQYMEEDYATFNNGKYLVRTAYSHFLTTSLMGFGLLWDRDLCLSSMDLTQVNDSNLTIKYAYDWAGYEFEIIEKDNNKDYIKERIVDSINKGIPVLGFGIVGPPECLIISGYDENGKVLIGWSHFQDWEILDKEQNGMFRKQDWYDDLWKIVITGKKIGRKTNLREVIKNGLKVMEKRESDGYVSGIAVYDEWINFLLDKNVENISEQALKLRHEFHHNLIGNHAEARYYVGEFLMQFNDEILNNVGKCFHNIHDLCRKIWGVLDENNPWIEFRNIEKRKAIVEILKEIRDLDIKAMEYLSEY